MSGYGLSVGHSLMLYEDRIHGAISPLIGSMITPITEPRIHSAVQQVQREFLWEFTFFVPLAPIVVTRDGNYKFNVNAPIGSREEKNRIDREAVEREQILSEMCKEREASDKRYLKSMARLRRLHRRLVRRHFERLPFNTKRIWDTLTLVQQYNILKDLDYSARHKITCS